MTNLEGRNHCLIEILSQYLPEGTKEKHQELQSEKPVSRQGFEPKPSRIQVWSITSIPACSDCFSLLDTLAGTVTLTEEQDRN
jgi:hypothetical protein